VRVFFHTNVLVSAYAARGLRADVLRLMLTEHELLISGDPHPLDAAGDVADIRITSPRGFWSMLRGV
jgi:hypothetical protein